MKNMYLLFICLILLSLILPGCQPDPEYPPQPTSPESTTGPTPGPSAGSTPAPTTAPTPPPDETIHIPLTLLIFYGWPSSINSSSGDTGLAALHFGQYDYAVLGSGLEESSHPDHLNTINIINHPDTMDTFFFGYIDLGVITNNYSITEIENKVDKWMSMDVNGIFLDDYGYDFEVTRERQNTIVAYIHSLDVVICVNAWDPAHAFGDEVDVVFNPAGTAPVLNQGDYYLSESYNIVAGTYQSEAEWWSKVETLDYYQETLGFKVFSITTNDSQDLYDENKFFYSWYSALLMNYEAAGWGEYLFSADDSLAPFRTRPVVNPGTYYMAGIMNASPLFYRDTDTGQVWINTGTREAGFTAFKAAAPR